MASPSTGGYDTEFLDSAAKLKEFECPLCLLVTREPNLTSCCGQHFCQNCINQILTDRKPCPYCKEDTFTVLLDKKQKRGCGWTGELGELATHTDTRNGNCQFVEVVCPNNCGETHQKRYLHSHISDTCQKRPFACEHCKFKATYELVCKHYDECAKFPLKCPNKCEIAWVERGKMKEHLSECPLQLVECEYAYAGCSEKIQRKHQAAHLEQNVQKHLLWAFTASQKRIAALERQMEERVQALKQEMEEDRKKKDKETDKKLGELYQQLEERDRQIQQLQDQVTTIEQFTGAKPPQAIFEMSRYTEQKRTSTRVAGPTFYTTPRGARVEVYILLWNTNSNMYVELYQLPGEYDKEIQWPVNCTVTVYLLNQLNDRDHISGKRNFTQ